MTNPITDWKRCCSDCTDGKDVGIPRLIEVGRALADEIELLQTQLEILQRANRFLSEQVPSAHEPTLRQVGWWQCPCCQSYYTPERIVCPVSGDNRPAQSESGAPRGEAGDRADSLVSPPVHMDPTGKTREPPHCPTCSCGMCDCPDEYCLKRAGTLKPGIRCADDSTVKSVAQVVCANPVMVSPESYAGCRQLEGHEGLCDPLHQKSSAPQHTPASLSTCMPDCPACAYYRAQRT